MVLIIGIVLCAVGIIMTLAASFSAINGRPKWWLHAAVAVVAVILVPVDILSGDLTGVVIDILLFAGNTIAAFLCAGRR